MTLSCGTSIRKVAEHSCVWTDERASSAGRVGLARLTLRTMTSARFELLQKLMRQQRGPADDP